MNWIETRANKERAIKLEAKEIYLQLIRSMERAVRSFNDHYPDLPTVTVCDAPYGNFSVKKTVRVRLNSAWTEQTVSFVCEFKKETNTIEIDARGGGSVGASTFWINADDAGRVFLQDQDSAEKSIEAVSQAILEPFLFAQS